MVTGDDMNEDLGPVDKARLTIRRASVCARSLARTVKQEDRLGFARALVTDAISAHWRKMQIATGRNKPLREPPADINLSLLPEEAMVLTRSIGDAAADLDIVDASYAIGVLYTALMPTGQRAGLGAYYTPPHSATDCWTWHRQLASTGVPLACLTLLAEEGFPVAGGTANGG